MPRKQSLPDTTALMHTSTQSSRQHAQDLDKLQIPALESGRSRNRVSPIARKLFASDTYWGRKNLFSPMQYH